MYHHNLFNAGTGTQGFTLLDKHSSNCIVSPAEDQISNKQNCKHQQMLEIYSLEMYFSYICLCLLFKKLLHLFILYYVCVHM